VPPEQWAGVRYATERGLQYIDLSMAKDFDLLPVMEDCILRRTPGKVLVQLIEAIEAIKEHPHAVVWLPRARNEAKRRVGREDLEDEPEAVEVVEVDGSEMIARALRALGGE
jgi:hypothetical protein